MRSSGLILAGFLLVGAATAVSSQNDGSAFRGGSIQANLAMLEEELAELRASHETEVALLKEEIARLRNANAIAIASLEKLDLRFRVGTVGRTDGEYKIVFNPPFSGTPTLVVSPVNGHFDDGLSAIVKDVSRNGAIVRTCRGTGSGCAGHAHVPLISYIAYLQ